MEGTRRNWVWRALAAAANFLFQSWGTPAFVGLTVILVGIAAKTTQWVIDLGPMGFVGALVLAALAATTIAVTFQAARRISLNTKYYRRFLDKNPNINPLDTTFQHQRIYLNDFVLPSFPFIVGKTFINCEIIGPANIYLENSTAHDIPPPSLDAVALDPSARFYNGFTFRNCLLRGCSYHRITVFVPQAMVDTYRQSAPDLNWISFGSIEQASLQLEPPKDITPKGGRRKRNDG